MERKETDVAGSLWRRARGKLFLSDKYLQKIGECHHMGKVCARAVQRVVGQSRQKLPPKRQPSGDQQSQAIGAVATRGVATLN